MQHTRERLETRFMKPAREDTLSLAKIIEEGHLPIFGDPGEVPQQNRRELQAHRRQKTRSWNTQEGSQRDRGRLPIWRPGRPVFPLITF